MPTLHGETYIEDYVNHIVNQSLPSALKLDEIKQATSLDKELREISRNIHSTWPAESRQRHHLFSRNGILLFNQRILMPSF